MESKVVRPIQLDPGAPTCTSASCSLQLEQNPVLSRLLDEVRNERDSPSSYDRVHNRHNRGK